MNESPSTPHLRLVDDRSGEPGEMLEKQPKPIQIEPGEKPGQIPLQGGPDELRHPGRLFVNEGAITPQIRSKPCFAVDVVQRLSYDGCSRIFVPRIAGPMP